jgi:hypothetical protein
MKTIDYFGAEKMSLSRFCNFCKKNSPLIISVTLGLFFTYGIKLVSYSIGVDSESFAADKPAMIKWNTQIGRFGLALLQRLYYIHEFNPLTSFFVACCFIWLFTISWCYCFAVFNKKTGRNNKFIPFALLFMTTPVWAEQFYFVFQSAETACMIFLCPYVIYLLYQGFLHREKGNSLIIGKHENDFKTNFLAGEVLGHSCFAWSPTSEFESTNRGLAFMQSLGINYNLPDKDQMNEARAAAESMPSYPSRGSVKRLPDMIVIKLCDSTYDKTK